MWHVEYAAETDLAPGTVWAALRALETGEVRKANGDQHVLNGSFEVGQTLTSSAPGIPPIQSTIAELVENQVYAIRTNFNELILLLRITLSPLDAGGTKVVRGLEITGVGANESAGIAGPRISGDYPEALAELIEVAGKTLK